MTGKSFSYSIKRLSGVDISAIIEILFQNYIIDNKYCYLCSLVLFFVISVSPFFFELRYKNRIEGNKEENIETHSYLQIYGELSKTFSCLFYVKTNPVQLADITLISVFTRSFIHSFIHAHMHASIHLLTQ